MPMRKAKPASSPVSPAVARRLTKEAIKLNKSLGDPRQASS
jgi:hypothetical protein